MLTKKRQTSVYDDNDDVEIEELERKLNLKRNSKIPSAFFEDGLGGILDFINLL